MTDRELVYCDLNLIDYKEAWNLQKEIFRRRVNSEIEDVLFLLEHPSTYTLGKTADRENLKSSEVFLRSNQISVYDIDRGGDITYHGPGQIVGYPVIDLSYWQKDTHKYLRALEEVIIRTCAEYDLPCERNPKYTGVWINDSKIAAIGIKVSRWVTMHGFAFNINPDLNLFDGIIPCGIKDKSVTSLNKELNIELDISEVKGKLVKHFKEIFNYSNVESRDMEEIIKSNLVKI
jgi:lipoyl(octanoyl) transferase